MPRPQVSPLQPNMFTGSLEHAKKTGRPGGRPGPEFHIPPALRSSRKAWVERKRPEIEEYQRNYRQQNKVALSAKKRSALEQAKREGIVVYGGACACCGEAKFEFLTIDHINGRGDEKSRYTGLKLWGRLKAAGWPTDNFQLLCFNCNCAKGIYGECPHKSL